MATRPPLPIDPVFPVYFSNPSPLFKFAPDPDTHWKLLGAGEIVFKRDSLVMRGLRRRPDGDTVKHSAEILLVDVLEVTRRGRVVQFYARVPLSIERRLQFWAADEAAAEQIVGLLPGE